jgi:hypothetical protein
MIITGVTPVTGQFSPLENNNFSGKRFLKIPPIVLVLTRDTCDSVTIRKQRACVTGVTASQALTCVLLCRFLLFTRNKVLDWA